ncbi:MAG: nucleoside hydrolase [Devosiaceae bacterium]|nr:nucleoside hydrolase [Devosiaceae bacterium MH13]
MSVLIDTDPGLDDAVAILYALAESALSVEGVTAVAGNIGIATTTRNVGSLLAAMGRSDVPYASGASGPLGGPSIHEEAIHGADGLGGVALPAPVHAPVSQSGADFLADHLRTMPADTLTILALGPLTNLALLAQDAPDAYARAARVIAMGGAIDEPGNAGPHAEFNVAADPLAAKAVFEAPVPVTLIPLDVTRKLRATKDDLGRLTAQDTPAAYLAANIVGAYFAQNTDRASRPLHDPCVMLMALAPHLFTTCPMQLTVDCETHRGRLIPSPDGATVEVATTIDAQEALQMLWDGLGFR